MYLHYSHLIYAINNGHSATHYDFNEGDVLLFNSVTDSRLPSEFTGRYHVHILCNKGEARFRFNGRMLRFGADDLVIWQMSSDITD